MNTTIDTLIEKLQELKNKGMSGDTTISVPAQNDKDYDRTSLTSLVKDGKNIIICDEDDSVFGKRVKL